MGTQALNSLLDYLSETLTKSNMQWLGEHLIEEAQKSNTKCKGETEYISASKEMLDIIAKGDQQIKSGHFTTTKVSELWN